MRLADDAATEDVLEQCQLRRADRRLAARDLVHGAVALVEPDRPVRGELNVAQVALLVLDIRQRADTFEERSAGRRTIVGNGPARNASARWRISSRHAEERSIR